MKETSVEPPINALVFVITPQPYHHHGYLSFDKEITTSLLFIHQVHTFLAVSNIYDTNYLACKSEATQWHVIQ